MQISLARLIAITAIGLGCSFALTVFLERLFGPSGATAAVLTYPLYALVSWPLVRRLSGTFFQGIRSAALKDVHGSFYSYQGTPIRVVEDIDHCRWVPVAAVRKIIGTKMLDETFAKRYPSGWKNIANKGHLREDALHHYLSDASALETIKFKNWVQKSLVNPAKKVRNENGIVIGLPTAE